MATMYEYTYRIGTLAGDSGGAVTGMQAVARLAELLSDGDDVAEFNLQRIEQDSSGQ